MEALIPEAANSKFAGKLAKSVRLPDGTIELQIVCDPPEPAIRELATGSSVPVQAIIRRLNPLAAAGISWTWWLLGAVVLGSVFSEARSWRTRRKHAMHEGTIESPRVSERRLDWGGDPDEFLEYVVGVGIVPRKLRRTISPVDGTDDHHVLREQTAAPTEAQRSSTHMK